MDEDLINKLNPLFEGKELSRTSPVNKKYFRGINLLIEHFIPSNNIRLTEYLYCLRKNLKNNLIKKIFIFIEEGTEINFSSEKIEIIKRKTRPSYKDIFCFCNETLNGEVCVVSNGDIIFDENLIHLEKISLDKVFLALSRWEIYSKEFTWLIKPFINYTSQDSWIFKPPIPASDEMNFKMGTLGCDNRISMLAKDLGYTIQNPGKIIRNIHFHLSHYRTYLKKERVPGPYLLVPLTDSLNKYPDCIEIDTFDDQGKPLRFFNKCIKTLLVMQPKSSPVPLIRIGGRGDGAYLIPNDIEGIKACFSPGVSNRKDFEDHLTDNYGIQCHMCDKSSDIEKFKTPLKNGMQTFKKKWLDINSENDCISLEEWIDELAPNKEDDLILQMDIEGAEYRNILGTKDKILRRFRIIVIELHNLGVAKNELEFEKELEPLLEKIDKNFLCVHAHPNNCCGEFIVPGTSFNLPNVHELTFLRRDRFYKQNQTKWYFPLIPHPLDIGRNVIENPPLVLNESWSQGPRHPESIIKALEDKLDYYISTANIRDKEKEDSILRIYGLSQAVAQELYKTSANKDDGQTINDIAKGKQFYLSSSYCNYPQKGLVGAKDPFFFHTGFGNCQFITIDFGKISILEYLFIANRIDGYKERARCLFYTTHNSLLPNLDHGFPLNIDDEFLSAKFGECKTPLLGVRSRFITIFSPLNTALQFSDLRVMGMPAQ